MVLDRWTFVTTVRTDLPNQAESMSCNLNSGGDGCRRTRTDLKHVEDRTRDRTRARVLTGGGSDRPHALG